MSSSEEEIMSDEIDEEENDDEEDSQSSENEKKDKKIKIRTAKEILEKPLKQINKIYTMFNVSGVVARQLLKANKWFHYSNL